MSRAWVLALVAAAACAEPMSWDGLPLADGDLVVVAHQDDDLLFMQPDMFNIVSNHLPITVVYVTAGDGGVGLAFADTRIRALTSAYGLVANARNWDCGWIELAGHAAHHCRLADANVSLVFMGYPDGGVSGENPMSLLSLWEGKATQVETISHRPTHYDQAGLIAAVAETIEATHPRIIRTLEIAGTHGDDHSDHLMVGALTVLAVAAAGSDADLLSYRGYNINYDPANSLEPIYEQSSLGMRGYEACALGCATCGEEACPTLTDQRYLGFVHRRYAIGIRRPPLMGQLHAGTGCAMLDGNGGVKLGDCGGASTFEFDRGGNVRVGDRCLEVLPSGELITSDCGPAAGHNFMFDDEGHLWTGLVPPASDHMATNHTTCVIADGDRVRVDVCGTDRDARWDLLRQPATTLRHVENDSRGRAIRLTDLTADGKADMCRIEQGALMCAVGDGTGRFGASVRIDSTTSPLAIEPQSLALGDVDGDGRTDACGRRADGIVCATAVSGFSAVHWSGVFARVGAATANDRSLAIVNGAVCGLSDVGVACVTRGLRTPMIRSDWPAYDAVLWPGDLDGDGVADWCAATPAGPACGLASDTVLTDDGVPWGFSEHAKVEGSVAGDGMSADTNRGALADVSGDGRDDLCVLVGGSVECAISQGHGFGPRATILALPAGTTATALWMGDLDGDGKADPCVDDGVTITCASSP